MDGSVIEDLGGGVFSSFLGKENKMAKIISCRKMMTRKGPR